MARKTKLFIVDEDGRDKGKMFLLTELPAMQAEKWAIRAFLLLAKSGLVIPDEITKAGMEAMAVAGFNALAGLSFADAEPLLDEMLTCVSIVRDKAHPDVAMPMLRDAAGNITDIEEVPTIFKLRQEVFNLHVGFLKAVGDQKSKSASTATPVQPSPPAPTSPQPSPP